MNAYLNDFKYTNAFTEDLWDALGKASGKPVGDVMTTWTKQMGYPVIKVSCQWHFCLVVETSCFFNNLSW